MSAISTGLRMAWPASGQSVEVDTVAPDVAGVSAAHGGVGRQYPPTASRQRRWTLLSSRRYSTLPSALMA